MTAILARQASRTRRAPHALLSLFAAAVLLAGCGAESGPAPGDGASTGDAATEPSQHLPSSSEIAAAVEPALKHAGVPGAAILITDAEGREAHALIGESTPGSDVTESTRFAYRSITKSVVGTVVLQLAEEGEIDLDAPLADYVEGVPGGDGVTVRQLATMRSGLPNYSASPALGDLLSADPEREPRVQELLDLAYVEPADFAPGEKYEYSNTNTLLLGEIIESVTGASWEEAVEDRVFRQLGMSSAAYGFTGSDDDAAGFQLSHGEAEELPTVAPGWFGAAGGLTGDVQDLARWGRALGSGELLEKTTQQERLGQLGPIADDPQSPEYDRYGFAMGEIEGWIGHTGNGLGFQALVMYEPESADVVAILVNGTGEDPDLPATLFKELLPLLAA